MNFFTRIPLFSAKIITVFLYLLLAFWVLRKPKSFILEGAPAKKTWYDLRLWALILIGIQIVLYFIF